MTALRTLSRAVGIRGLVLLCTLAPALAHAQSGTIDDYVLIAEDSIRFANNNLLAFGAAAVDRMGGQVRSGKFMVSGDGTYIVGDSAAVLGPSSLYYLFANSANLSPGVSIRAVLNNEPVTYPGPVLSSFPTPATQPAGGTDLVLSPRQTVTLPPGSYGQLRMARASTVIFTGGTYSFEKLRTGRATRLLFTAPTTVYVGGFTKIGQNSLIAPIGPQAQPDDIQFHINYPKVRMGRRVTLAAKLWAPTAKVLMGSGGLIKGQLLGKSIRLGKGVITQALRAPSISEPRTPTPTISGTPTNTPTITGTPTETGTPVPPTNTPTDTPTEAPATVTSTITQTATETPSSLPTETSTTAPTETATSVDTETATPTIPAPSNTPTATATATSAPATATATTCSDGLTLQANGVDQVALVVQLGGSVTQVGGTGNGNSMTSAASFSGSVTALTGVNVSLPNYLFASSVLGQDISNSEPGNSASVVLGTPTDMTFTAPGSGGPDGTAGDGSLIMDTAGNFVTVGFGTTLCVAACTPNYLVLFTDTAGGGSINVELLLDTTVVATYSGIVLPGGAPGSGFGGVVFAISSATFDRVRVSRASGSVEIDAIALLQDQGACGGNSTELGYCGDGIQSLGEECDDGNTVAGDGCSPICRTEENLALALQYCTVSQGGWGASGGIANGADGFLTQHPEILPITIGGSGASTTLLSQSAVIAYLPKNGTPTILLPGERVFATAGSIVPDGGGSLAGQTAALSLSINLSNVVGAYAGLADQVLPTDSFCTQGVSAGVDGVLGTSDDELNPSDPIDGPYLLPADVSAANNTTQDLLNMANQYLRGSGEVGADAGEITSAIDTMIQAFDGCRRVVECP